MTDTTPADEAAARVVAFLPQLTDLRDESAHAQMGAAMLVSDMCTVLADRDSLAARVAELELVPRCGATTASGFLGADPLGPCILDHGHGGMHQEASTGVPPLPGARWTERNDPLAVAHARIRELEQTADTIAAQRGEQRARADKAERRVAELEGKARAFRRHIASRLRILRDRQREDPHHRPTIEEIRLLEDLAGVLAHLYDEPPPDTADGANRRQAAASADPGHAPER